MYQVKMNLKINFAPVLFTDWMATLELQEVAELCQFPCRLQGSRTDKMNRLFRVGSTCGDCWQHIRRVPCSVPYGKFPVGNIGAQFQCSCDPFFAHLQWHCISHLSNKEDQGCYQACQETQGDQQVSSSSHGMDFWDRPRHERLTSLSDNQYNVADC